MDARIVSSGPLVAVRSLLTPPLSRVCALPTLLALAGASHRLLRKNQAACSASVAGGICPPVRSPAECTVERLFVSTREAVWLAGRIKGEK